MGMTDLVKKMTRDPSRMAEEEVVMRANEPTATRAPEQEGEAQNMGS